MKGRLGVPVLDAKKREPLFRCALLDGAPRPQKLGLGRRVGGAERALHELKGDARRLSRIPRRARGDEEQDEQRGPGVVSETPCLFDARHGVRVDVGVGADVGERAFHGTGGHAAVPVHDLASGTLAVPLCYACGDCQRGGGKVPVVRQLVFRGVDHVAREKRLLAESRQDRPAPDSRMRAHYELGERPGRQPGETPKIRVHKARWRFHDTPLCAAKAFWLQAWLRNVA